MSNSQQREYKKRKNNKNEKEESKKKINRDKNIIGLKTKRQKNSISLKVNLYPKKLIDFQELIEKNNSDFIVFKSINDILTLIYCDTNKNIISYDLKHNKKLLEIKRRNDFIDISYYPIKRRHSSSFKHFLDKKNKRDLILLNESLRLIIFDNKNFECISSTQVFPIISDFIMYNNNIYVIFSEIYSNQILQVYDLNNLNGERIKLLDCSDNPVTDVDIFYDLKLNNIFIIIVSLSSILSYDYNENQIYHYYSDLFYEINEVNIINDEDITKLLWSDTRNITIFDFHSGDLLYIISSGDNIQTHCLWNNQYIIVATLKKNISSFNECSEMKLIDLINGKIINDLLNINNKVKRIKLLNHPIYGKCLIAGVDYNKIKIFTEKSNSFKLS